MIQYNSRDYLISLHIPKCGGISFDQTLKTWFGKGYHRHWADHNNNVSPERINRIKLFLKPLLPVVIHGHFDRESDNIDVFDYYPDAKQFIAVLRDPVERQLSQYFYTRKLISERKFIWHGKVVTDMNILGVDADDCLENHKISYLRFFPWIFTKENYKQIIDDHFVHIGLTEDLQKTVDVFAEKLGRKSIPVPLLNTAPKLEVPSESSIRKFKENNELEYLVYDYVLKLNS